ncbi:MAG: hypothetical protein JWM53_4783, partial [bacterium]|nr:hypothetical protein [bacterium]
MSARTKSMESKLRACITTFARLLCTMAALGAGGCFGSNSPRGNEDASYGTAPDLGPQCAGNNDGVIARNELAFPVGMSVNYLSNPNGTTASVAPDGSNGGSGVTVWDLTSTAGDVHKLTLEALAGKWFAGSFPGATYATTTDLATNTLGIFRVADEGLYILGYASETPNQTLLVYDTPILSLKFPVTVGDSWVSVAHIVNGTLNGMPYAGLDTYKISIDARGTVVLPFLSFDNTMRVHVDLTQTLPGGISVSRIQ